MDWSSALPTFVITLREGVEAALVVGIVLACLKRAQRSDLNFWVYSGVAVGVVVSALVGVGLGWLMQDLGNSQQPYAAVLEQLTEAVFSLIAIAMLSWMLIWMTQQARSLKSQVEGSVIAALKTHEHAGLGVFGLVLVAVLREGFETVLFVLAKFQQGFVPALGALAGLALSVGVGVLLFKWGIRLNLKQFFRVMGVLLLLIVAGLVITTLGHVDAVMSALAGSNRSSESLCFYYEHFARQHSCILGPLVWNTARILPDDRFPGIILSALFGYTQYLYQVQAVAYFLFLLTIGSIYFQSIGGRLFFIRRRTSA